MFNALDVNVCDSLWDSSFEMFQPQYSKYMASFMDTFKKNELKIFIYIFLYYLKCDLDTWDQSLQVYWNVFICYWNDIIYLNI